MSNVVALTDRAELWADRIWKTHGNGIAAILAIGADLVAAKKALSHGEWGRMTGRTTGKSMLPFGYATARCLMGIAQNRVIRNVEQCSTFPLSWGTLYELTKLPEAILEEYVKAGRVHPDMTRAEAQALREIGRRPKPQPAAAITTTQDTGWGFDFSVGRCTHNPPALHKWLEEHKLTPAHSGPLQQVPEIHLEARYLPLYALLSLSRGVAAYGVSFLFTMIYGYAMARVAGAERVMLPVLDILQSIPVLGFLPGFVLGLVHLFPHQNLGLEIASVLMIFTGQVWNMTFSFYSSLKSVPPDLVAVARLARMSWWERFCRLDLSFAATGLLWNSMMSMAGGWFFLMVSEAFVLGEHDFRLPGLGSYMSLAIERGDGRAQLLGVLAMLGMIAFVDQVVWRPLVAWSHKFTDDEPTSTSATVLVGENPASHKYVSMKRKACAEAGMTSFHHELPATATQAEVLDLVRRLGADPKVHGILVQLPLPSHIDEATILDAVPLAKDVDGFHPLNIGGLAMKGRKPTFAPCTPAGVIELLDRTGTKIEGADAVVLGRSNIVGMPVSLLLIGRNATVTVCHSRTKDLAATCRRADILVAESGTSPQGGAGRGTDSETNRHAPPEAPLAHILPWYASTIRRAMGRPRPMAEIRVVKKGSKTLSRSSGGIPGPASDTAMTQRLARRATRMRTRPWPCMAWPAFSSRLQNTRRSWRGSPSTSGLGPDQRIPTPAMDGSCRARSRAAPRTTARGTGSRVGGEATIGRPVAKSVVRAAMGETVSAAD